MDKNFQENVIFSFTFPTLLWLEIWSRLWNYVEVQNSMEAVVMQSLKDLLDHVHESNLP